MQAVPHLFRGTSVQLRLTGVSEPVKERMTLREVRATAERRTAATSSRIEALAAALTSAAARTGGACAVCGRTTDLVTAFVIPVAYVAAWLVHNDLDAHYRRLPTRRARLCGDHQGHFGALFVDVSDPRWDVERLERRAEVLGGVLQGGLLVFGGSKALTVVAEFHEAVTALKASMNDVDP